VVAHEWVECTQLRPSSAQLRVRVPVEAADVSAHQRDAKQVEVQYPCINMEDVCTAVPFISGMLTEVANLTCGLHHYWWKASMFVCTLADIAIYITVFQTDVIM